MIRYSLCVVLILLFSNLVALAQPIYGWRDDKGQWYFSDMPPAGVSAKKIFDDIPASESLLATPQTQPNISLSATSKSQENPIWKLPSARSSAGSPASADRRWLLILPPSTRPKAEKSSPFAGWRPVRLFESDEACFGYKAALLSGIPDSLPSFSEVNSNCVPASEFITGKEADVSVTDIQFEPTAVGFSSHLLSGRVFNRGNNTARRVVAKYEIRDRNGVIIAQGEASTNPADITGVAFGEFRTPSIGGWSLEGVRAQAEADWVKE
jgi:Domain of unknown function (DUF4124)